MVDERLKALCGHIESGGSSPDISLVMTSGVVVRGPLVSEKDFVWLTRQSLGNAAAASNTGMFGRTPPNLEERIRSGINAQMGAVMPSEIVPDEDAKVLHVAPARMMPLMGASLEVPALRLNLAFVQAWWLGVAKVHEMKFSGGGVGVGVTF